MKKIGVAGYGSTKFSKHETPIEELLVESTKQLFETTPNLSQDLIDGVLVSTNDNSKYLPCIKFFQSILTFQIMYNPYYRRRINKDP